MYQDRLAVAIKVNGKVLREFKDAVYIPFGSEYSILVKNLHSRRCMVRMTVDGQDATEGVSLIVPIGGSVELERFIKGGNLNEGNRFKFIERTSKIEEHRGIQIEDGLVRIEYEFEREVVPVVTPSWYYPPGVRDIWFNSPVGWTSNTNDALPFKGTGGTATANSVYLSNTKTHSSLRNVEGANAEPTMDSCDIPVNDAGITVPGSVSDQTFTLTSGFLTDGIKHVMVLKMLGQAGDKPVIQAVTVKTTQKCSTCGHVNKATAKFCSECGTSLTIV